MIKCEYAYPAKKSSVDFLACKNPDVGVCAYQYYCPAQRKVLNTPACLKCVERNRRLKAERDNTKE